MVLQLEAAKADRASVEGDITYRNNRIEDVRAHVQPGYTSQHWLCRQCCICPDIWKLLNRGPFWTMTLQAETSWRAAATQLEALTKTHDGVVGQLREAQDRTALAEQEKIEVSPRHKPQLVGDAFSMRLCCVSKLAVTFTASQVYNTMMA